MSKKILKNEDQEIEKIVGEKTTPKNYLFGRTCLHCGREALPEARRGGICAFHYVELQEKRMQDLELTLSNVLYIKKIIDNLLKELEIKFS